MSPQTWTLNTITHFRRPEAARFICGAKVLRPSKLAPATPASCPLCLAVAREVGLEAQKGGE